MGIVTTYLSTLFKVKYDIPNNFNIENISIPLTTTITATKLKVALIIKEKVDMINMIVKIRITMIITEQNNNSNNNVNNITIKNNHKYENIDTSDYQSTINY